MSREIMQQALEKYLLKEMPAGTVIGDPVWWSFSISKVIEAELAKPEQSQSMDEWRSMVVVNLLRRCPNLSKHELRELAAHFQSRLPIAQPEQEPVTNSDLYSTAGRLALELECLLLDTKDISIVSKWWDSAHEALDQWRKFHLRACIALDSSTNIAGSSIDLIDSATRSADSAETFGKPGHYE